MLALVDTGCSQTILAASCDNMCKDSQIIHTVDGRTISDVREISANISVRGHNLQVKCLAMPRLVGGLKAIVGMDVISKLGGVTVRANEVRFGCDEVPVVATSLKPVDTIKLEDKDFSAEFDGVKWVVRWRWRDSPPVLKNSAKRYAMNKEVEERFEREVDKWVEEGWLQESDAPQYGHIPMLAVVQEKKDKVRPVMDYRELNEHIQCHTGDSEDCQETLRRWRHIDGEFGMLDLRNAYLQIHVEKDLQKHQIVFHRGKYFALTRLGFGLNCAPRIMSVILDHVLSLDSEISENTDHYLDDIVVNTSRVSVTEVAEHLKHYGLETKPPEKVEEMCILGLQICQLDNGTLSWRRRGDIPEARDEKLSRRELFSICGKLVSHYPVANWLRVACSYLKRTCEGSAWDDDIGEEARQRLDDIIERLQQNDPVRGRWKVPPNKSARVWCDASSLAVGALLEIDGDVVEDMAWLRKKEDGMHINVTELDSVLKGINIALKWGLKSFTIMTDSATVYSWLQSLLSRSCKIRTSGISEMLVKRRLQMVSELCEEYELRISVELVKSAVNKADALTRVPQKWLLDSSRKARSLRELHRQHHFGIERTLHSARQVYPDVSREEVERVIKSCRECQSIDPMPTTWSPGELSVEDNWYRLAMDVVHYEGGKYLTMIDCGPSRFAIWRKIPSEEATIVASVITQVFREHGAPCELLLDNSATFHSKQVVEMCEKFGVHRSYRCAYRPSGNGIVERHHRTIKARAARARKQPEDIVMWYNMMPLGDREHTVPALKLFRYAWRNPCADGVCIPDRAGECNRFMVGDSVLVKPPNARCTTRWFEGAVTGTPAENVVEVDGTPRHVADCRPVVPEQDNDDAIAEDGEAQQPMVPVQEPRPQRERRLPSYLKDYEL